MPYYERHEGVKFAIVREDPRLELELIERFDLKAALCVVSGGDTLLELKAQRPKLYVAGFDHNLAQCAHLNRKVASLLTEGLSNEEHALALDALNQRGDFEDLFRVLRYTFLERVAPQAELDAFFDAEPAEARAIAERWIASPYWSALFAVAFAHDFIEVMFGPAALQYAPRGSYPRYFQHVFERGLRRDDATHNPFLQHVFLQKYLPRDRPFWMGLAGEDLSPDVIHCGQFEQIEGLERFDLIQLSNLFDWLDDEACASLGAHLARHAPSGAHVLIRQLNNHRPLTHYFQGKVRFDEALGQALWERDRSLFYERVHVGVVR